ncbi:MAG: HlyD family efflux transporter periplasmic adaptor subunit [Verrucomicrobiales bacterium]|nr:HlyD family efflux transporter periplasmic adaptor subunit [Verrucomicrobiales bacterium]
MISNVLSGLVCLLLAALILVVFLAGRTETAPAENSAKNDDGVRILKVNTLEVSPGKSFHVKRTYNGITKARQTADLGFERGGRIKSINVDPGDEVKKNGILAELDAGTDMKAPFDGFVSMRHATVGAVVSPGTPVLRIVEDSPLEVWFSLPVDVADKMSAGEVYELDLAGDKHRAKLDSRLPEVDRNGRTRTVIFTLPAKVSEKNLPGQTVQLEIDRVEDTPGFWVPLSALTRESRGLWSVFSVENDADAGEIVERHFVEVFHVENSRAWVDGTVFRITNVVATGTHRIVPGQKVKAVPMTK